MNVSSNRIESDMIVADIPRVNLVSQIVISERGRKSS